MNDDSISRNTLLRHIADWQYSEAIVGNEAVYDTIEKFYHMVEEMPSAQPEKKIFKNMSDGEFEKWLYEHGIFHPDINESIPCDAVPYLIDCAINELPSAQPESRREWYMHGYRDAQPRWIPIKEALPDDNKDVLVTVHFTRGNTESSYYVDLAYRLNDEWMSYSDDYLIVPKSRLEIIAWMPLPSPLKEE